MPYDSAHPPLNTALAVPASRSRLFEHDRGHDKQDRTRARRAARSSAGAGAASRLELLVEIAFFFGRGHDLFLTHVIIFFY
jgi:hypothetical protein